MTRCAISCICGLLCVASSNPVISKDTPAKPAASASARQLVPKAGRWNVHLGPTNERAGHLVKVPLPSVAFHGEHPLGAAYSLTAGKAAMFYHDLSGSQATKTRVMLCDPQQGQIISMWWVNSVLYPLDLDAAATRILARSHHHGVGKKDTLEILTTTANGTLAQRRWVPYREESEKGRDILWARFVGTNRVVTVSATGKLTLWDSSSLKPLGWVPVYPATPALSPNGRYVAFLQRDSQVGLLDVAAGTLVGQMPLGVALSEPTLAFRPDGQALACAAKDMIVVLDIPTGRVEVGIVQGITGRKAELTPSVGWVDERLLFVNGFLVDPARVVPLWQYSGGNWSQPCGNQVLFLAQQGFKEVALVPVEVPSAAVRQKIASAPLDKHTVLLRPNDSVQVDVSRLPKENQREAKQVLEKHLRDLGYVPTAQAALRLEASIAKDDFRNTSYSGSATVQTRVLIAGVRLLRDEKEIWKTTEELTSGPGFMVFVPSGRTVAGQLAGHSIPDWTRLGKVKLPRFLIEHHGKGSGRTALGSTWVHPERIR